MKKLTLLSAAAIFCCAVSPVYSQVQILRSAAKPIAPRLVSDQTELDRSAPQAASADEGSLDPSASAGIPNPFDYFSEDPSASESNSASSYTPPELLTEQQSLLEGDLSTDISTHRINGSARDSYAQEPASEDSDSHPVGRQYRHSPTVVDTIVNQATLDNTPHCATTPIYWGTAPHTPNAVADWLLREQCVAGLWDGYPQQRAAECAHMWAHLAGHSACGSGCATVCGPCSACASHSHARHNRYTGRCSAHPSGSEICSTCQPGTGNFDNGITSAPLASDGAPAATPFAPGRFVKSEFVNATPLP